MTLRPEGETGHKAEDKFSAFVLERYLAFTKWAGWVRRFDVDHPPWNVAAADLSLGDQTLIEKEPWFESAELIGAHMSPGLEDVGMSWPADVVG